jgi:hypothetical protein
LLSPCHWLWALEMDFQCGAAKGGEIVNRVFSFALGAVFVLLGFFCFTLASKKSWARWA